MTNHFLLFGLSFGSIALGYHRKFFESKVWMSKFDSGLVNWYLQKEAMIYGQIFHSIKLEFMLVQVRIPEKKMVKAVTAMNKMLGHSSVDNKGFKIPNALMWFTTLIDNHCQAIVVECSKLYFTNLIASIIPKNSLLCLNKILLLWDWKRFLQP